MGTLASTPRLLPMITTLCLAVKPERLGSGAFQSLEPGNAWPCAKQMRSPRRLERKNGGVWDQSFSEELQKDLPCFIIFNHRFKVVSLHFSILDSTKYLWGHRKPVNTFPIRQTNQPQLGDIRWTGPSYRRTEEWENTEPGGYDHATHIQFPVLLSKNDRRRQLPRNKHHWKTLLHLC